VDARELVIRPLCAADLERIFSRLSRQHGAEWLARQERDEVYVAVAEIDAIPVGRVALDFTRRADVGAAVLWAAHVEPGWQSRGIGTTLFLHVEAVARERGFAAIELAVAKDNPRALALYKRLGYEVVGEGVGRWSYRDGDNEIRVVEDEWNMRKALRRSSLPGTSD
jgi:ribosomal protein S18 acetylase RimI-like enzyme